MEEFPSSVQFSSWGSQGFSSQIIVSRGSAVHPSLNVAPPASRAGPPGVFWGCFPAWREPALRHWCQALNSPPELNPWPGGRFCSHSGALGSLHVPAVLCPSPAAPQGWILSPGRQAGMPDSSCFSSPSQTSSIPVPPTRTAAPTLPCAIAPSELPAKHTTPHSQCSQGSPAPVLPSCLC